MRACRFYTPNAEMIERHDGLELSAEYGFDRPILISACVNPKLIEGNPFTGCGYEKDQTECQVYEPDPIVMLRKVHVYLGDEDDNRKVMLYLATTRLKFGIREYYIILTEIDTEDLEEVEEATYLHRVNAHDHGLKDAFQIATELFEVEMEQQGYDFDEAQVLNRPKKSYIAEVVA